jgi:uncharacterized protein (DUF58 family)
MRLLAEAAATTSGFQPLVLPHHAPKSVFGTGAKPARQAGGGEGYWQHRNYAFGDSTAAIDWRQSARSDALLVREQERMLPHHAYLAADPSSAMLFNSRGNLPTKNYAAQRLLLALGTLLQRGESEVRSLTHAGAPKQSLGAIAHQLSISDWPENLPPQPPLKPRSYVFIASDFRQGQEVWQAWLRRAAARGIGGYCLQMLDPIEVDFPLYGRVRLESAEDESHLVIPAADAARPWYQEQLQANQARMEKLCTQYGWSWLSFRTDETPRAQLGAVLKAIVTDQRGTA